MTSVDMNHRTITIYWSRHAESCSNFDKGSVDDKPPNDYNEKDNIGYDRREKNIEKISNNLVNPHKMLKAVGMYHPNLSFIGIQQAILLGTKFLKNHKIDAVFVSPTVRTIMTALIAYRSQPNIII